MSAPYQVVVTQPLRQTGVRHRHPQFTQRLRGAVRRLLRLTRLISDVVGIFFIIFVIIFVFLLIVSFFS